MKWLFSSASSSAKLQLQKWNPKIMCKVTNVASCARLFIYKRISRVSICAHAFLIWENNSSFKGSVVDYKLFRGRIHLNILPHRRQSRRGANSSGHLLTNWCSPTHGDRLSVSGSWRKEESEWTDLCPFENISVCVENGRWQVHFESALSSTSFISLLGVVSLPRCCWGD